MPVSNHKATTASPADMAEAAFEAALSVRRSGDWQACLGHLEHAIRLAPGAAKYHAEAGAALFMLDRPAEATRAYERALTIKPDYLAALNNLGVLYSLARQHQRAEEVLQRSLAIDRNQPDVWLNLCSLMDSLDSRDEDQIAYARNAVALRARSPEPYSYLGKALMRNGDIQGALDAFAIALSLNGNAADLQFRRGLCYLALERIPEAVQAFQAALAANPQHAQTYLALADLLTQQGDEGLPAAEEACRLAIQSQPNLTGAAYLLARILFGQERYGEAIGWYETSVAPDERKEQHLDAPTPEHIDRLLADVVSVAKWSNCHSLPYREVLQERLAQAYPPTRHGLAPLPTPAPALVPAAYVAEIENAVMLPGHEPVLVDEGRSVLFDRILQLRSAHNFLEYEGVPLANREKILVVAPPLATESIPAGIFMMGHYWQNYAHWLMEHLPRLYSIARFPEYDGIPILINDGLYPQQLEALAKLAGNRYPIKVLPRNRRFLVRRLIYPSNLTASINMRFRLGEYPTPDDVVFHPEAIDHLRQHCIPEHQQRTRGTRRLWVSRGNRQGRGQRRLRNEPEVQAWFESHGFETIYPERMSFAEQVATFADADIVAGNSGAGMINTLFSPPSTRILMFVKNHPLTHYYYFGNVAQALGQQLTYVCGTPMPNLGVPVFHADFTVALDDAKRALEAIESNA